jgi:hypothetical protein
MYRVGEYQIVTSIEDGVTRVLVLKIGNRREVSAIEISKTPLEALLRGFLEVVIIASLRGFRKNHF